MIISPFLFLMIVLLQYLLSREQWPPPIIVQHQLKKWLPPSIVGLGPPKTNIHNFFYLKKYYYILLLIALGSSWGNTTTFFHNSFTKMLHYIHPSFILWILPFSTFFDTLYYGWRIAHTISSFIDRLIPFSIDYFDLTAAVLYSKLLLQTSSICRYFLS
jgi:hypothetical protein